jgi:hypothetical protein
MKPVHNVLLASSFLIVTYVAAPAPAHAGGWLCAQSVEQESAQKKVDSDTDIVLDVARHGLPCRPEVEALKAAVEAENLTYVGIPDQCVIQALLDQEMADLRARAAAFVAHEAEVRQAQFQIVLGRYERAVNEIRHAWETGSIAEDIAEKALYSMRVDAFDYLESLGLVSIRARLQEAITELVARGEDAMNRAEALHDTFKKLYELRLEASLKVFEVRVANGTLTKFDILRVDDAIRGLDHLQIAPTPGSCAH